MSKPVFAEIDEDTKWIEIYFRAEPKWVSAMHDINASFVPKERGGPFWRLPLEFTLAKRMGQIIGKENLTLGDALNEWAWIEKAREDELHALIHADDAELSRLPDRLPDLAATLRPDQRVGVQFMASVRNVLCGDQMGLGKTLEAIGAIFEADVDEGPHLVIAPLTSLEDVWLRELETWQDHPVLIAAGEGMPKHRREQVLADAQTALEANIPFWLVINPNMVRYHKVDQREQPVKANLRAEFPILHETQWASVIIDECHKVAVRHPNTLTAKGMFDLKGGKRIAMSGTPLGGKIINVWGVLHYLEPKVFTSKWRWAFEWLDVTDNGFGKDIGGVRPDKAEAFDRHLAHYMIRRLKSQVLKDLPPKQRIDVWCDLTPKQKKQYVKFAKDAEISISGAEINATSILAEYVRMKQFANAAQEVTPEGKLIATNDSGKLLSLMQKLDELGIVDGESDEQAVIGSQFETMVNMVYDHLVSLGIPTLKLVGKTKNRREVREAFQASEARVIVMTTQTGGVSITLDRASNVFILDEMWNPDEQEQLEDRCHRASRIHQVTVYYLRTKRTIDEYIKEVTDDKGMINRRYLEERRGIKLWREAQINE